MIIGLAIKQNNTIYVGYNQPVYHNDIIKDFELNDGGQFEYGYITDNGEFLNGHQALEHVMKSGQKLGKTVEEILSDGNKGLLSNHLRDGLGNWFPYMDFEKTQQFARGYNSKSMESIGQLKKESEFAQIRSYVNLRDVER